MPQKPSIWTDKQLLDECEREREKHRNRYGYGGRVTYDCVEAKVNGDRVTCHRGTPLHPDSKDGGLPLAAVLRGKTAAHCRVCEHFSGGE